MKPLSPKQSEALQLVAEGKFIPDLVREEDGWHARWRAPAVDNPWVDEYVRGACVTPLSEDAEDQKFETLHDAWMLALRSRTGLVRWNDDACAAFAEELADWHGAAEEDIAARKALTFAFQTNPPSPDQTASPSPDQTASPSPDSRAVWSGDALVPATTGRPEFLIRCTIPLKRRALRALGQSAYVFGPLRGLATRRDASSTEISSVEQASRLLPLEVALSRPEAESFLRAGARELVDAGYTVTGCDIQARVTAAAEVGGDESRSARRADPTTPNARPSPLNTQHATLNAKLVVKVDGEAVSAEEIRFLLEQKSTLVFFRDRWIEVDRNILKEALRALEKHGNETLSVNAAVAFASGIGAFGRLELEEVRAHGWLRGLLNELRAATRLPGDAGTRASPLQESVGLLPGAGTPPSPPLRQILRPYQARGVAWMKFLTDHGFGALLADDMGLGKTVQTIGWILASRGARGASALPSVDESHPGLGRAGAPRTPPVLIVAPLTLLSNWRHEFAKFAPALRVYVHQGDGRQLAHGFRRETADCDAVITSYSLLVRDYAILRETDWFGLVLDEAQAIKNPDTQVARAVRSLGARRRVALTGTPIENSVADVWSLEEYLNPTFLGDRKSFLERFVKPIAADERSAAGRRLRHALEPFILRRLKSDPEIAGELGEKREIKEYCALFPAQRADYETALEDYRVTEKRQGDIFALITRLKLVCDGEGKVERLCELLGSIFAAGESALVFTQYAKVGAALQKTLADRFGVRFPFLHGALSARAREAEIARFNAPGTSCFLLSLKAGGFGLNLTKATHVIHFDRWWNPAVEAQATDRAHRIGQAKTVFVHAFITEGTLEEHVDEILERKARVAGSLVQTGESFLRELSPADFERAVKLDE